MFVDFFLLLYSLWGFSLRGSLFVRWWRREQHSVSVCCAAPHLQRTVVKRRTLNVYSYSRSTGAYNSRTATGVRAWTRAPSLGLRDRGKRDRGSLGSPCVQCEILSQRAFHSFHQRQHPQGATQRPAPPRSNLVAHKQPSPYWHCRSRCVGRGKDPSPSRCHVCAQRPCCAALSQLQDLQLPGGRWRRLGQQCSSSWAYRESTASQQQF